MKQIPDAPGLHGPDDDVELDEDWDPDFDFDPGPGCLYDAKDLLIDEAIEIYERNQAYEGVSK